MTVFEKYFYLFYREFFMQMPLEISFENTERSAAVIAKIEQKVVKLQRFYKGIIRCRVVVTAAHHHQHKGKLYHIRIDLTVPGGEIVVNTEASKEHAHEDVYVALRDAFDKAKRQLEDFARKQHGQSKHHEAHLEINE